MCALWQVREKEQWKDVVGDGEREEGRKGEREEGRKGGREDRVEEGKERGMEWVCVCVRESARGTTN